MSFMAVFPNGDVLLIFGTEEDIQHMDCEKNIIFAITTDI